MRKLYTLIAGLIFSLVLLKVQAQNDVANFTFTTSGNTVHFTNSSGTVPNDTALRRCYWQFGDGTSQLTFFSVNPYHNYSSPGTYQACLYLMRRVTPNATNGDSLVLVSSVCKSISITAADSCRANFETISTNPASLGEYFIAQPWHNNNKKPIYICWDFGDNHDTCIQYSTTFTGSYAVFHQYANFSSYNACVKITYDGGCQSSYCKHVVTGVQDSCKANFQTLSVSSTTLGRYFVAQPWNNHNKKPVQVCWNFGDGHDTCVQYSTTYSGSYAVYHLYQHSGAYNACVNILYDGGCSSRFCNTIQLGGTTDSCSVNFETLTTNSTSTGRYFIAQPWNSNNKKPIQVCWNFGDSHDTCMQYNTTFTGQYAVYHLYSHPGTYYACVSIRYDGGCESHYCKTVQIPGSQDSCKASFERIPVSTTVNPLTVAFHAITGDNQNKKPSRICWTFGDNRDTCITYSETYSGSYNVGHTYLQSGHYQVCVDILYYGGCEAKKCDTITVILPPDTCRVQVFEATTSLNSLIRGFYALPVSSNNRRVERICWNFGDGNDTCITQTSLNFNPAYSIRHTYPGPGTYHICVTITFAGGCITEKCIETVIRSTSDICGGYFVDSLTGPRTFKFRGQSIHNPNDNVISYHWAFGDGSTDAGKEVIHTFGPGNNFEVCLSITTQQGCESRICKRLIIPGINASILQLSPNPVISNLHVVFISNFSETINIRIVNSYGTPVRTYVRNVTAGPNVWDFDLSNLIPGVYSFTIQSPDQLASSIFLKQ
ncbi:MAG TPA: PKD domain-containing protein [Chitinophagaceae bacterium]|nr:PKD domain-containing protein [Chitinophagaceae bacterium]